jgi:hypothetical protein
LQQGCSELSIIHFTLDLWASTKGLAMMGIISNYVSEDGNLHHDVLAFREREGLHTGENQYELLRSVFEENSITSNIGFFHIESATNNDTLMDHKEDYMMTLEIALRAHEWRLHCPEHVINLLVKAFLFGNSKTALHDSENVSDTEQQIAWWIIAGPLGRAHNIGVYIRRNTQRIQEYRVFSGGLLITKDNDTCCNSWYMMLKRLLQWRNLHLLGTML